LSSAKLLALYWCLLFCAVLPFGLFMQQEISEGIGPSRVQQELRGRMDMV